MPAPGPLTANVAAQVKARRAWCGWSAADLAIRVTAAGVDWDRQVVAKLENGRRLAVSVDELDALARVFDVPDRWDLTKPLPDAFPA